MGGNIYAWSHPLVIASLVGFCVCVALFVWAESRVALPIMPLHFLTRNPCAGLILSNFFSSIVMNAIMFNIPLFFQAVLLESATSSGLRLIVPSIAASAIGTATGFLITGTKRLKPFLVLGGLFYIVGTAALCTMQKGLPDWAYLLFLVPQSIGQGFSFPTTSLTVLAISEQREQAVVTSTLILWRSIGQVLGVATSSLVLQNALFLNLESMVSGPGKEDVNMMSPLHDHFRAVANAAFF